MACDPLYAPSKPDIPKVIKTNSVQLRWTKPIHDGGSASKNYTTQMTEFGSDYLEWKSVTALPITSTELTVTGLEQSSNKVNFRIIASNEIGASEPSIEEIVDHFD